MSEQNAFFCFSKVNLPSEMVTSLNIQLMYLGITMAFKMLNQFQVSSDISPSTG